MVRRKWRAGNLGGRFGVMDEWLRRYLAYVYNELFRLCDNK